MVVSSDLQTEAYSCLVEKKEETSEGPGQLHPFLQTQDKLSNLK